MIADKTPNTTIHGISSGYAGIDNMIQGWQPGDLIVIASCPSFGKTALALSFLKHAAVDSGIRTLLLSLEAPENHIVFRLTRTYGEINLTNFIIDDTHSLSLTEICDKIRTFSVRDGVKLIGIDYIQLVFLEKQYHDNQDRNSAREQEMSEISKTLKSLAKECGVAIIVTCQFSPDIIRRKIRINGFYTSSLYDLKDSRCIGQYADIVMFLHRTSFIGMSNNMEESVNSEVIIVKNRDANIGTIKMKFLENVTRFEDVSLPYTELL